MEYNFNEEQIHIVIAALSDSIANRDEDIRLNEFFMGRLKERIKNQQEEIESLKAKLKALQPKKQKSSIVSLKKARSISSKIEKRGRGRPKKAVK